MIKSLRLRHWKSHEQSYLRFGEGTNVLVGPMGAGKTSVLDAICFALYGTFPALRQRLVTLDDVVMARPRAFETAEVELEFSVGEDNYVVARTIGPKGSEAFIRKNGAFFDGPQPGRVNEALTNLLHVDYDLFSRAIYSEQNRIDYFLNLPAGERKRQIDELLGIDRFESARKNAVALANKLKAQRAELANYLRGVDAPALQAEESSLEGELQRLADETASLASQEQAAKTKIDALARELSALEERQHILQNALAAAAHAEGELSALQHQLQTLRPLLAQAGTLKQKLDAELSALAQKRNALADAQSADAQARAEKRELDKKLADAKRAHAELEQTGARLQKIGDAQTLQSEVTRLQGDYARLLDEANRAAAKSIELEDALKALAHEGARCPVCDAELSPNRHAQLREEKKRLLVSATDARDAAERNARQSQVLLEEKRRALGELDVLEKKRALLVQAGDARVLAVQLQSLSGQESRAAATLASVAGEVLALQKNVDTLRLDVDRAAGAEKLAAREKQFESEAQTARARADGLRKTADEAKLASLRADFTAIEKERSRLQATRSALEGSAREKKARLVDVKGRLAKAEEASARAAELDAKTDGVTVFGSALLDAQASLRSTLIESINEALNAIWPAVYPYGDYKALRVQADGGDYALELQALDGAWVSADSVSGGERACAALSLRVAFAMVLTPNLSWLVLDEPTHNLDREAVLLLANALREEIPKIVKQVFLITHDEALKESASARLYRIERDKDKGEQSVVEEVGLTG